MNNRFVKNNMGLLAVTGVCALIALVGLVFLVIYSIQMEANMSRVKELSGKIATINKKRPVPVEGNKKPIQEDIEVYENASRRLQTLFGRPLAPATERFFQVLTLKKSMWLPEGIDENDEVIVRLNQLSGEHQFSYLRNREFNRYLDLIAAEELLKKAKELAADENEEKAKQILALIPDLNTAGNDVLAKRIAASAKLGGLLQQAVSAAELAKRIKALPAGNAALKQMDVLFPGVSELGEAELIRVIAASEELDKLLKAADSPADLATQVKDLPADDEKAKTVHVLIPAPAKLGDEELAKKLAAMAELNRQFREIVWAGDLARLVLKGGAADDAAVGYIRTLIPNVGDLGEADLVTRIADAAKLNIKLRELVPDSDPETLKRLREISDKFTADQFLEAYNKIMEGVDEKNYADQRTRFDDFRRDKFENWSTAREAFINAVLNRGADKGGPCIVEKLDAENADDVLLAALGVPRRMSGESANLKRLMNNITGQLTKEYQVTLVGKALGLGIIAISTGTNSESPMEGDVQNISPEDYPSVTNHLDIISYMLYRVGGAGVVVWDVQIRMKAPDGDNVAGGRRFGDSKEQRDGFDIYHYTLEISGTMAQIRDALSRLDNCYEVRRVYLVRNVALYAENNIADSIFTGNRVDPNQKTGAAENLAAASTGGRRRRPRSGNVAAQEMNDNMGDDAESRLAAQKKLDEEYERRQQQLDVDKRDGYGETIAGGDNDTFRAVIDVEYVVKPAK